MIRTNTEYRRAVQSAQQSPQLAEQERRVLQSAGLTAEEIEYALQPLLGFQQQALDEIEQYENWRQGRLPAITRLSQVGVLLIAARIARGMKQRELASRLGVSTAVVSRDEANEYGGITLDRAHKILDALGITIHLNAVDMTDSPATRDSSELPNVWTPICA